MRVSSTWRVNVVAVGVKREEEARQGWPSDAAREAQPMEHECEGRVAHQEASLLRGELALHGEHRAIILI